MLNGLFMYVKVRILRIIRKKKTLNAKNNLDSIRKFGKQEILDYVIDHHMTMRSCEKVFEQSKAFDAIGGKKVL